MATEIKTLAYYSYQTVTKWEQFMAVIQAQNTTRAVSNHSSTHYKKKNHYLDKHTHDTYHSYHEQPSCVW